MGDTVRMTEEEHRWLLRRRQTLSSQLGWACIAGIATAWFGGLWLIGGWAFDLRGWTWFGAYFAATGTALAVITGRIWLRRGRKLKRQDGT